MAIWKPVKGKLSSASPTKATSHSSCAQTVTILSLNGNLIFLWRVDGTPPNGWNQGLPRSIAKVAGMSRTVTVTMLSTGPTLTFAWKVPSTLLLVLSYALIRAIEGSNSAFSILNFDNSFSGHTFKADPSSTITFLVWRPLTSAWMNKGFIWFLPSGERSLSEKVI